MLGIFFATCFSPLNKKKEYRDGIATVRKKNNNCDGIATTAQTKKIDKHELNLFMSEEIPKEIVGSEEYLSERLCFINFLIRQLKTKEHDRYNQFYACKEKSNVIIWVFDKKNSYNKHQTIGSSKYIKPENYKLTIPFSKIKDNNLTDIDSVKCEKYVKISHHSPQYDGVNYETQGFEKISVLNKKKKELKDIFIMKNHGEDLINFLNKYENIPNSILQNMTEHIVYAAFKKFFEKPIEGFHDIKLQNITIKLDSISPEINENVFTFIDTTICQYSREYLLEETKYNETEDKFNFDEEHIFWSQILHVANYISTAYNENSPMNKSTKSDFMNNLFSAKNKTLKSIFESHSSNNFEKFIKFYAKHESEILSKSLKKK